MTELFADLFVGERQQLGIRQSDPSSPSDGEAWLRDDLTDSANDKIGELRWYVGSATNSVPIFDAGTSGTGVTEELRVQINGQTGFLPVTQSGAFTEHRIQSGGQTRTLTDTKALDVLFDILSISTNEPISVGEDLLVDYAVENTGSDQGTDDIDLLDYTDTVVDTQTKTLNSNEQTSDQLVWTTSSGDDGDRQITVRSSATSLSKTVSISAIPDSVVDDFEDNELSADSGWTWTGLNSADVVSSPALEGNFSGRAEDSSGDAGLLAQRDTSAELTSTYLLTEKSNTTEQGGEWAIGKVTGSASDPRFNSESESDYDFISRASTSPNVTGGSEDELYLVGGSGKIATISADTTYSFYWQNIDYANETYDFTVTRISDDTEIASVSDEPFYESVDGMDFVGATNAIGVGGSLAVYVDDIYVE